VYIPGPDPVPAPDRPGRDRPVAGTGRPGAGRRERRHRREGPDHRIPGRGGAAGHRGGQPRRPPRSPGAGPRPAPERGPARNTNKLARRYPALSPAERLSLLVAAAARGDDGEHARLMAAAPRVAWRVPHTFARTFALLVVSALHRMESLELAALLF